MGIQARVLDDVKDPGIADNSDDHFIDITLTFTDEHDPWEVDYLSTPQKISQCGIFEDADGEEIRIKAWNGSDPIEFKESKTYDFTDAQLVYGKESDAYSIVVRSKTQAEKTSNLPSGYGTPTCPAESCGTELGDDDLKHGPDAPQIGWEYYECPECGARHRPESV